MRIIGKIENELHARRFSAFLEQNGIANTADAAFDAASGHFSYTIWVHNEDQLFKAAELFERFEANPADSQFELRITDQVPTEEAILPEEAAVLEQPRKPPHATLFFLVLCSFVFLLNLMQSTTLQREGITSNLITPIQTALLYDVPPVVEQFEAVVEKYKVPPDQKLEDLPRAVKAELEALENTPYWRGIYDWILLKLKGQDTSLSEGTPFIKIRQGEIWRLFSPALLHSDLLHILFNMLWLWLLGRQIELRIGSSRYILLTLLLGIGSNTAQYLMSGPFFLGYSGVIMGLTGFIWMREKIASWEGYPLQRSMILFLVLFVLAMFALQLGSFLLTLFTAVNFSPNIANTAHIAGALLGALLARLNFFSARPT